MPSKRGRGRPRKSTAKVAKAESKPKTQLVDLPTEILMIILNHVDPPIWLAVARTCKSLSNLTRCLIYRSVYYWGASYRSAGMARDFLEGPYSLDDFYYHRSQHAPLHSIRIYNTEKFFLTLLHHDYLKFMVRHVEWTWHEDSEYEKIKYLSMEKYIKQLELCSFHLSIPKLLPKARLFKTKFVTRLSLKNHGILELSDLLLVFSIKSLRRIYLDGWDDCGRPTRLVPGWKPKSDDDDIAHHSAVEHLEISTIRAPGDQFQIVAGWPMVLRSFSYESVDAGLDGWESESDDYYPLDVSEFASVLKRHKATLQFVSLTGSDERERGLLSPSSISAFSY